MRSHLCVLLSKGGEGLKHTRQHTILENERLGLLQQSYYLPDTYNAYAGVYALAWNKTKVQKTSISNLDQKGKQDQRYCFYKEI